MISKVGGRKVIIGMLVLATGITVDATFGLSSNLLYLMIAVSTGFFLGNGMSHLAKARVPQEAEQYMKPAGSVTIEEVNAVVGNLIAQNDQIAQGVATTQEALNLIIEKTGLHKK